MAALAAARILPVRVDKQGAVPDERLAECDLMMLTPGHQCPSSVSMPLARRQTLIEAVRAAGTILVENDYDADLFVEGEKAPPLRACDAERNVIYVGSFSKILSPGLRLGFVVAPPPVIEGLRALRRLVMRHPPANNQRAMACFIAQGHFRGHLRRLDAAMAARAQRMDSLLARMFPDCSATRGQGAASVWMRGPEGLESTQLAQIARQHDVLVEPGAMFFSAPEAGARYFRLGFSSIPSERIEPGLRALRTALDEVLGRKTGRGSEVDLALFSPTPRGLPARPPA